MPADPPRFEYPSLPPDQRELAEVMSRMIADRLSVSMGAVLAEIAEDVGALVELARVRQHRPGSRPG